MKATKIVKSYESVDIDSIDLLPGITYNVFATVAGYGWYSQPIMTEIKKKYSFEGRGFDFQADDFTEIVEHLHLAFCGDFQSAMFMEVGISWTIDNVQYNTAFWYHEPESIPEEIRHYFIKENHKLLAKLGF